MIAPADAWGPFAGSLDPAEQRARLRALRVTARLLCGPRALGLCRLLAQAEQDATVIEAALAALNTLAPLDRRSILASYAATSKAA